MARQRRRRQPGRDPRPQRLNRQPGPQQANNCYRCGTVFNSRNQLMRHVRSRSCQQTNHHPSQVIARSYTNRQNGDNTQSRELRQTVGNAVNNALACHSANAVMSAVGEALARHYPATSMQTTPSMQLPDHVAASRRIVTQNLNRPVFINNLTVNTTVLYQATLPNGATAGSCTSTAYATVQWQGDEEPYLAQGTQNPRVQECESDEEPDQDEEEEEESDEEQMDGLSSECEVEDYEDNDSDDSLTVDGEA